MPLKRHMACMTSSGGAVHLCKDTAAPSAQQGTCPAPLLCPPGHRARNPCSPHSLSHGEGALTSRRAARRFPFLLPLCSLHPLHTVLCSFRIRKNSLPLPQSPGPLTRLAPASCVPCSAAAEEVCAQVLAGTPIHTGAPEAGGRGCKVTGATITHHFLPTGLGLHRDVPSVPLCLPLHPCHPRLGQP